MPVSFSIPGYRIVKPLHESGPRVVVLAARERDGEEVVLKTLAAQYPSKRDVAELRREYQIARSLRGVSGVIRVHSLETHGHGSLAIVMEPFGLSLADLLREREGRPLPLEPFLQLSLRLTEILGELHQRNIVHKDVVPRNVLVKPRRDPENFSELCLIDFGISSELHRERQSTTLSKRLEGSLPYISPEQTGRTNRDLDYRSDYYSLGVTFFELSTGKLPFAADGALEWVHRHISMPAPSASSVNPEVPPAVSAILLKLMSKNAEDRYQSGYGLNADLQRCLDSLRAHNRIEDFELGKHDVSRSFRLPQRLYGRDAELSRLESCFQDVASGLTDVCLLSGASGVGKSALACELTSSIVARGGYLVVGKFEQFQRSGAYSAFARAFDGLVRQLLGEPRERLDAWRTALSDALGPSLRLIVELVPALELVTGPCPPLAKLPPTEAQNRFQLAFVSFVKVLTANSPLVVFMDDLQWSDAPTLGLLQRLATAREMRRLLVIGAFRSNLVDAGHPLSLMLDEVRKARSVTQLSLRSLELPAIQQMLAEVLYSSPERVVELAGVVFQKAHGNPFFVRALLQELVDEGTIRFDAAAGRWDFDLDAARRKGVSENVVEFVAGGLRRLPESTQQVLELAACIGSSFELRTLAIIYERSPSATAAELEPAVKQGVLLPTNDQYKLVALDPELEPDGAPPPESAEPDFNPSYRFQHDRVQQAAYALIDAGRKQSVHLSIGRSMHEHASEAELEEHLLQIAAHLNAGRKLLESPAERLELARLNLRAARKAMASAAYEPALELLEHGQDSLPADRWESQYELTLGLAHEYQQCAYLTGDHQKAEVWVELMLERARTNLEKAKILSQRTRQYATTGKMRESIQAAIAGLSLLDIAITEDPSRDTIRLELDRVRTNLAGRSIPSLIDAPRLTEARQLVAIELLMEIFPAAFLSASGNLFPYLVLKAVNLSLEHGNSPESAFAYAAHGMLLCGALEDQALGYEFGKLAVAMNEQFEDIKLKSRVIYVYAMFIHHWTHHWSSMTPWFQRGIEAGYQSGDLLYLAYSAQDCVIWDPKLDLETATAEQRKYLTIVRDCKYRDSFDSGSLFLQMQLNFQGLTRDTFSLSDEGFDELECVSGMLERRFITGIANFHIYKAEIHFLYGDYAGALEHVVSHEAILASSMSLPQLVRARLIAFLTRAALLAAAPAAQRADFERSLREILSQFTRWAAHCSENFEHLRLLMEAELAAHADEMRRALSLYDASIRTARQNGFVRDEAVANEAAARYLAFAGVPKAGEAYLRAAQYLYYRWGAKRKLHELRKRYPELPDLGERDVLSVGTHRETTSSRHVESLDMASVMKASQAISGEVVLERLWKVTLQILLENAGGQRGFLIVRKGSSLFIEARGEAGVDAPAMTGAIEVGTAGPDSALPLSVLNSVFRSREAVILNDATQAGRFAADPYLVSHRPQSLLCVPVRHGPFDAVLYIENTLTRGALTEERIEVVRLLSAQAAISTENAELYEAQLRLIEAQRRFVPSQFLESLGHHDIAQVGLGEYVAKEMSVLFSDLRDFTPLAERLKPGKVIELLNEYFSRVGAPIMEMGGFIDTYNGDEIMALFGGSPDFAVRAGVGMRRALERFNRDLGPDERPQLAMGIGVNTGPLVLGTVGARERLKCGVVGDTVNLASRIEQLTKRYGAPFLIGESTYAALAPDSRASIRVVDRVAVKGKQRGVTLYEVLDAESDERRQLKLATRPLLQAALASYDSRDFPSARDSFGVMAQLDPEDQVPRIFLERCQRYLERAPADDWEGYESLHFK
jgi:predicted ATPase/class 3 adenylate cyclase